MLPNTRFFLVSVLLVAALCHAAPVAAEDFKLGVAYVNDTHGHLLPYHSHGEQEWGGFARMLTAIERERSDTEYNWLVLHAGDAFQGTALSNMFTGLLDIQCLNIMGFDAMCLGNHEFDFGYANICDRISKARFDVLCANAYDRLHGTPVAKPYVILERAGYKIGLIGIVTESLLLETDPHIEEQVDVYQAIPVVKKAASYLRSVGCDLIIVLSHQGYCHDVELAHAIPEVDLVIGGHSHTFLDSPAVIENSGLQRVLVTQDGCNGDNLGVLRLTYHRDSPDQRFRLDGYESKFVPLKPSEPKDSELYAFLEEYEQQMQAGMGQVVRDPYDIAAGILRWMHRYLSGDVAW